MQPDLASSCETSSKVCEHSMSNKRETLFVDLKPDVTLCFGLLVLFFWFDIKQHEEKLVI